MKKVMKHNTMKYGSLLLLLICFVLMFTAGFAYAFPVVSSVNTFEMGFVDIELKEYSREGDEEQPYEDGQIVVPGQTISKIPRVENKGTDCYIRAKFTFHDVELTDKDLIGLGDGWERMDDGYYYYTNVLKSKEKIDLFEGFMVPTDISNESIDADFSLDVHVDAIQSKNFTPDFAKATPWGNIEILKFEKDGSVAVARALDTKIFTLTYEGEVQELVMNDDDLFSNFATFLPGDEYTDTLMLHNPSSRDITLYFSQERINDSPLLDRIGLKITFNDGSKDSLFYEGNLGETFYKTIGVLPAGVNGKFTFELSIPAELNNEFALLASELRWTFSTDEIKPAKPEVYVADVVTGVDNNTNLVIGVVLMLVGLAGAGVVVYKIVNKKDKKGKQ